MTEHITSVIGKEARKRTYMSIINTILTGIVALLPAIVLVLVFIWALNTLTKIISPITKVLTLTADMNTSLAQLISLVVIGALAFFIGSIIRTRFGKYLHSILEKKVLAKIPFYKIIKSTIDQFFGEKKQSPFKDVYLADVYNCGTYMTGFATDKCKNYYTIFVPTGPNPTSGNIYHIPKDRCIKVDTSIDMAMKSIIGCGMSSHSLTKVLDKEDTALRSINLKYNKE
jgi:uncharacterized membrane protein